MPVTLRNGGDAAEQLVVTLTTADLRDLIRAELEPRMARITSLVSETKVEPLPDYLSRRAAAKECGVSTRTIDRAISTRELRSVKRGARRLIRRSELTRWLSLTSAGE